jgi:S1-C subfamily serine protease
MKSMFFRRNVWASSIVLLFAGGLALWTYLGLTPAAPPAAVSVVAVDGPPVDPAHEHPTAEFPLEIRSLARTATIRIANETTGTEGSGVLVGRQGPFGYVLTAHHVVDGGTRFALTIYTTTSYPHSAAVSRSAAVVACAAAPDLAVLRFTSDDTLLEAARLCPLAGLPQGAFPALSVGCDQGGPPICMEEKVLGRKRLRKPGAVETAWYWEADFGPAQGRSGGALLDCKGRVIGLASGAGDGRGYYTHAEEIRAFLVVNDLHWLYGED